MIERRFLAQYVCVNHAMQARIVVKLSPEAKILSVGSLDSLAVEPANTLFRNGLITGELFANAPLFQAGDDVIDYMKNYTKPICVGEQNELLWWQDIDFKQWKFTATTRFNKLI